MKKTFNERLGDEMTRIRNEKGVSQRQLAIDAGVSFSSIQNIEYATRNTTLSLLILVCKALDANVVEVLGNLGE